MNSLCTAKSRTVFRQLMFVFATLFAAVIFLFFAIYERARSLVTMAIDTWYAKCSCTHITQLITMHPVITVLLLVLSVLVLGFIIYATYQFIALLLNTRKFSQYYLLHSKKRHSWKLNRVISKCNLNEKRIIEVKVLQPIVFCFGLFKTRICISEELVRMLHTDDLEAVLMHEHQHMISHDPMRLLIVKFFYSIFFFLPGLRTYITKYMTYAELAADEYATHSFSDNTQLASAILKISEHKEYSHLRTGLATSFFTSTIEERVNKLTDHEYVPRFTIWRRGIVWGVGAVLLFVAMVSIFLFDSSKAFAMHTGGSCSTAMTDQDSGLVCNISSVRVCTAGEQHTCDVH